MQKILRKRILRDLRENFFRYFALGFLIIIGMYIIISLVGAADTIMVKTAQKAEENYVEDGEFTVFVPLTDKEKKALDEEGVVLEEHFYIEYDMAKEEILRVFADRKAIDLVELEKGRCATKENEIVLEKRYCEEHQLSVGDVITFGGREFVICGIGTTADYEAPYRNLSDSTVDSEQFGVGFVTTDTYEKLRAEGKSIITEEYVYAYRLEGDLTEKELKSKLRELSNLIQFIPAEDNMRIGAAAEDQIINKVAGLVAGVIVLVLFTYVISVFVVHGIEKEASIIGTLYAMGVKRRELIQHYLTLPVVVTGIAGMIGTVLGYSSLGVDVQMKDCYEYFSVPSLSVVYEPYLLVYGILMPPVVAAIVNYLIIWKKLDQPALKLIRNEQKVRRGGKLTTMHLGKLGFIKTFQIRQSLRELRTAFTVFFGLFISLLIVMIGLNCYVLCEHISVETKRDTKFEYMYTYKYPEETVPKGGEAAYAKTLKREAYGYTLDVTLLGIDPDNPYFDAPVEEGKNRVLVSSAMAQKFNLKEGDEVVLEDESEEQLYAFYVDGIVQYSTGFYAFMDIDSMRELMGESDDYYNVVFSDHELAIDSGRLYATVTKEGIAKSADVFVELLMSMIIMMGVVSALIFVVVMYLMMKVMIDRSAFSISLMKIFGYRTKEIRKLYLNGNFYIVAVSALIGIPLSKKIMDAMYPYMIANVACGMNLSFSWQLYAGLFGSVLLLYFVINRMLTGKLKKLVPADVLKNRE